MLWLEATGGKLPFIQTTSGAIILVLVAATAAWVFGIITWLLQRLIKRNDQQTLVLTRLADAVMPQNRRSLVERVETLETDASVFAKELESIRGVSDDRRLEFLRELANVKESCRRVLDSIPDRE